MGVSVSSQYNVSDGKFLACAHRYRIINSVSKYSWGKGICILFENDFYHEPVEPCDNYRASVTDFKHDQCQCQAGTGVIITPEGDYLIGAPGSLDRRGSMHKNHVPVDLFDQPRWYDYPVVDGSPQENATLDDYLGMAVGIGTIIEGRKTYVAGAPRKMRNFGQVALFLQGGDRLELQFTFTGEQIASGFGYELTVGDFNSDGKDDLVVGAPFYFERGVGGAIYIYLSGPRGVTAATGAQRITSRVMSSADCDRLQCEHARFGYALTNIGDLDRDGYSDLAVGAPLEGNGVVYIFRGSSGAMSSQYSQRITAADVSRAVGLTNFGHTFGHTPGLDLDSNTYPDLIVGAYSSGTVVVLRSKPVVNVRARLISNPGTINPDDTQCSDGQPNTCFQLTICLEFSAEPANSFGSQLSMIYRVEAEKFRGAVVSRVYFKGRPETSHFVDGDIYAQRMNSDTESCVSQTVYIKANNRDILSSIYFQLDYRLPERRPPTLSAGQTLTDLSQFPVVNPYSERPQLAVPFMKNCGDDDVCTSELHLTVTVLNLHKNEYNEYELKVGKGSSDELVLGISVVNRGEDAHEATVTVTLPSLCLTFRRSDEQAKLFSCTAADDKVFCSVGNPMHSNEDATFQLTFGAGNIQQSVNECEIIVVANTTSADTADRVKTILVKITIEADLAILGRSNPSTVGYRKQIDTLTPPADWDAIGPEVKHIYEVRNVGVVRMPPSTLNVHWPLQLSGGTNAFVLYLVKEPQITNEFTAFCNYDSSIVNPLGIPERTGVPLSNAAAADTDENDADVLPQTQPSRHQRAADNVLECDGHELQCATVRCDIAELLPGDSAVITFHARLWNRTISQNFAGETELRVMSTARLSVDADQTKLDNDVLKVGTKLILRADDVETTVPWWIILLAVIAGLLLLLLLILIMWKVGFFKRKRLSEYQAARMSSDEQEKLKE